MSMSQDDLENQDDPRGLREAVERSNREAAEAKAALEQLQRKDAFRDAGLNPADPLHAAVISGYQGELDGVGAFVAGLGLNTTKTAPAIPDVTPEEREAMERMSGINTGDGSGQAVDPDADGNARLQAIVAQGRREGWGQFQFNEAFVAEMKRQGRAVQQLEIQT